MHLFRLTFFLLISDSLCLIGRLSIFNFTIFFWTWWAFNFVSDSVYLIHNVRKTSNWNSSNVSVATIAVLLSSIKIVCAIMSMSANLYLWFLEWERLRIWEQTLRQQIVEEGERQCTSWLQYNWRYLNFLRCGRVTVVDIKQRVDPRAGLF